jgi:hypothetical protein
MNCVLLSAYVGWCANCNNVHGVSIQKWGVLITTQIAELVKTVYVNWCLQIATVSQYSKRKVLSCSRSQNLFWNPRWGTTSVQKEPQNRMKRLYLVQLRRMVTSGDQRTDLLHYYSVWQQNAAVTKSNTAEGLASWLLIVNGHRQTGQQHRGSSVRHVSGLSIREVLQNRISSVRFTKVTDGQCGKSCGAVFDNTPTSYVAPRLEDWLSWQTCFVVFLSPLLHQ